MNSTDIMTEVVVVVATAGRVVPLNAVGDVVGLDEAGPLVGRGDGDGVGSAMVGAESGAGVESDCGAGVGC